MRSPSTASCFSTYLLPHVLFVADFAERERIAKVCSLAWNIGLFPDERDRECHIENILASFFDNETVPPPTGVRQGYGEELRRLSDLKRDLFPWQFDTITEIGLEKKARSDTLVVHTGRIVERIELALTPPLAALPRVTKVLVQMHRDTQTQRATLEKAQSSPGLIAQIATRDMLTVYCAQRADLRGYHRMLLAWLDASSEPEWKPGIERFLRAVDEIEHDSKAVLRILAVALDAP